MNRSISLVSLLALIGLSVTAFATDAKSLPQALTLTCQISYGKTEKPTDVLLPVDMPVKMQLKLRTADGVNRFEAESKQTTADGLVTISVDAVQPLAGDVFKMNSVHLWIDDNASRAEVDSSPLVANQYPIDHASLGYVSNIQIDKGEMRYVQADCSLN